MKKARVGPKSHFIKGRSVDGKERMVAIRDAKWIRITVAVGKKLIAVEIPSRSLKMALLKIDRGE
jgi:hypothetical protein